MLHVILVTAGRAPIVMLGHRMFEWQDIAPHGFEGSMYVPFLRTITFLSRIPSARQQELRSMPIYCLCYYIRSFDFFRHTVGKLQKLESMGPNEIINNKEFSVPRKIVAIGNMDSNWGWAR